LRWFVQPPLSRKLLLTNAQAAPQGTKLRITASPERQWAPVPKEQHITALLLRALLDNSAHASCLLGSSSRHAFAA
jgi:hypothetical protein